MPEGSRVEGQLRANLSIGTFLLLLVSVVVAVLKQSDAELILPSSQFDLGGFLDRFKDGVPGGSFIVPLLNFKIPLTVFYLLGPLLFLSMHGGVVLRLDLLREASLWLRIGAIWLPPFVLGLIRWRFAPYIMARPEPPLAGLALEAVQVISLAADFVLVALGLVYLPGSDPLMPTAERRFGATFLRVVSSVAVLWLILVLLWEPTHAIATAGPFGIADGAATLVAMSLAWGLLVCTKPNRHGRTVPSKKEYLTMQDRICLLIASLLLTLAPAYGRAVDLSGERLVAQEPSETVVAALIAAGQHSRDNSDGWLGAVRVQAWDGFGRGIDLSRWHFPGGRFDRATMGKIRMAGTNLHNASLDYANLIRADLTQSQLSSASLRYADLSHATLTSSRLTGTRFAGASLRHATLSRAQGQSGKILLVDET